MEANRLSLNTEIGQFRQLKMQVQRQLKRDLEKANHFFNTQFPLPTISYKVRGLKAGVAYLKENEIRLNPILLAQNGQAFIEQVVPHEFAHLVVYQQFGRVPPHGKEWKMVMEHVLGVSAQTYHCFDVSLVQSKTFAYRCGCQTHQLSARRHSAVVRGQRSYLCRQCKQALIAVKENQ